MERSTMDIWVGLFVVAGLAALLILALKVGSVSGFSSADTYTVTANFENIGGLKPRAPVKSDGVVVGRVSEIRFDNEKFQAIVTINIEKNFKFPKDTSASILTSGLLGEQYIGLDGGGDSQNLRTGDKLTQTQSAVVLEKLIGQFLFSKAEEGGAKK